MAQKIPKKTILVSGSIAIDHIFSIEGPIRKAVVVKDGKPGRQDMMFTATERTNHFGGTGGNIAYGLGLFSLKPILFGAVGRDFEADYRKHLIRNGVLPRVYLDKRGFTSEGYIMSDTNKEQIGLWQPNVYANIDRISLSAIIPKNELNKISLAIFSAGTGKSIFRGMKHLRGLRGDQAKIIFDPGQVISIYYDKKLLEKSMRLADVFIGNEVEFKKAEEILGHPRSQFFKYGIECFIETHGKFGSILHTKDGKRKIVKSFKARKLVEATGAGDAYRVGFLSGLARGLTILESCKIGARVAAKSVEYVGGQGYTLA